MASHAQARSTAEGTYAAAPAVVTQRRSGWLTFVAVMFIAASALNALYGISALAKDDYFAVDELLFGDLALWGVLYLCVAAVQLLAGILVLRSSMAGTVLGVTLALFSAFIALLSIGAYPVWSVVVLLIDGLIIYALTVHAPDAE
jgi:hypothetical protein